MVAWKKNWFFEGETIKFWGASVCSLVKLEALVQIFLLLEEKSWKNKGKIWNCGICVKDGFYFFSIESPCSSFFLSLWGNQTEALFLHLFIYLFMLYFLNQVFPLVFHLHTSFPDNLKVSDLGFYHARYLSFWFSERILGSWEIFRWFWSIGEMLIILFFICVSLILDHLHATAFV